MYSTGGRYCLSGWEKQDTRRALETLKRVTERTWTEVWLSSGLRPKNIGGDARHRAAPGVSDDATVIEVRVNEKSRIFGCRQGNVFAVTSFDANHEIAG